jgi:hypothetical protein
VVIDQLGKTYVTTVAPYDGPVTTNLDLTAGYLTMHRLLRLAKTSDGIGRKEADRLDQRWDGIQKLIVPRRHAKLRIALHQFADRVRDHSGESIRPATARDLVAYAQTVYQRIGGRGTV